MFQSQTKLKLKFHDLHIAVRIQLSFETVFETVIVIKNHNNHCPYHSMNIIIVNVGDCYY